mgnify:CR=1 FL=1
MSIVLSDLAERLGTLTKLVLAEPVARIGHSRVTVRPLTLRGKAFFQLEYQQGQKVSHRNVARGALLETFDQELDGLFRSVTLCTETETRQYVRKANGAYKCTAKSGASRAAAASHNRKKEYILQEGENIPALVDLGVFTPEFKIVKAKYDKYKQINRFIELVDDAFRAYVDPLVRTRTEECPGIFFRRLSGKEVSEVPPRQVAVISGVMAMILAAVLDKLEQYEFLTQ